MKNEEKRKSYWLKTIPYSPVDLINRRAAATGSVSYAMATADAGYNGHLISVSFKPHAVSGPIWNAEYTWGGRVVIGRGSLESCLKAAKRKYDQGDKGCVVKGRTHEEAPMSLEEQEQLFKEFGFEERTEESEQKHRETWWTGTHEAVQEALSYQERWFPGSAAKALNFKGTVEEWKEIHMDFFSEKKNK